MSEHPTHDDLLGHRFALLDEPRRSEVRAHVDGCAECRNRLEALAESEAELLRAERRSLSTETSDRNRRAAGAASPRAVAVAAAWRSVWTPLVIAAATLVASSALVASPTTAQSWLSRAIIFAGATAIVAWLHLLVAAVERGWRLAADGAWRDLPVESRALVSDGVTLAAVQSVLAAQRKVRVVLLATLGMATLGIAVVTGVQAAAPAIAEEALAAHRSILPEALLLGLYLGAMIWASLRLTQVARAIRDRSRVYLQNSQL